jgi:ATP-dependent RNA helicase SUPV3L1/SUV3
LVAVLGPTNTGKTHLAVERMLGYASGMIGLPLRLLAREIYDRIVARRGARAVALITGEEKIVPARAQYFVCTVEAMPLGVDVEFLAVDEIRRSRAGPRLHQPTPRRPRSMRDHVPGLPDHGAAYPPPPAGRRNHLARAFFAA